MIVPGSPYELQVSGVTLTGAVLTRSQQRELIALVSKASKLESRVESVDEIYAIADKMVEMCIPKETQEVKDSIQVSDAMEIASAVLLTHMLNGTAKKKSELPPTSEKDSSADPATPGV